MQLIRVTGMDGAKAYQMPPNSVVPLFDADNDIMLARARSAVTAAAVRQTSKRTLTDKAFSPGQDRGMAQAVPLFQ